MMRSMFAGVAGLRTHQVRMDVVGNNIANVNTTGYKGSRATFQDIFSQTLRGAASPQGDFGGSNPMQVGLGMTLSSVDVIQTPGSLQFTGRQTDMAIEGEGFFVLRAGGQVFYSRAGNFDRDALGYLVNPADGTRVQGWMARPDGTFDIRDQSSITDIRIGAGMAALAESSTRIGLGQNLDANAAVGTRHSTAVNVYDSLGRSRDVRFVFEKIAPNVWAWGVVDPSDATKFLGDGPTGGPYAGGPANPLTGASGKLMFNADGTLMDTDGIASTPITGTFTYVIPDADDLTITLDFTTVSQSAANDGGSTLVVTERDGYTMGSLESFSIDTSGVISGVFSNGQRRPIAQAALAIFANPGGLLRTGANGFITSNNSGLAQVGPPASGGRGRVAPANLEMSNVDLSQEFTNMIVTQRGFQANSRVITASDELLQELVNMKR